MMDPSSSIPNTSVEATKLTTSLLAVQSGGSKSPSVQNEMVKVDKAKLDIFLHRFKLLEKEVESNKANLQQLEKKYDHEKKKNVHVEGALLAAETRLIEWVQAQLEKPDHAKQSKLQVPDSNVTVQVDSDFINEIEKKKLLPSNHPGTVPNLCSHDVETDGEAHLKCVSLSKDEVFQKDDCLSLASSGYSSRRTTAELDSTSESIGMTHDRDRPRPIVRSVRTQTNATMSPSEYEDLINQQTKELAKRKLSINQLQRLLEAKGNNNCDALSERLVHALEMNEQLMKSNTQKEILVNNFSEVYTELLKHSKEVHGDCDFILHGDCDFEEVSKDKVDSMTIYELRSAVIDLQNQTKRLHSSYQHQILEFKGRLLNDEKLVEDLRLQLKDAHNINEALLKTRRTINDEPSTMGELREENKYLLDTLSLKEKNVAKLLQEKERLLEESDRLRAQQKELQNINGELNTKIYHLNNKLEAIGNQNEYVKIQKEINSLKFRLKEIEEKSEILSQEKQRADALLNEAKLDKEKEKKRFQQEMKMLIKSREELTDQLNGAKLQHQQNQRQIEQLKKQVLEQQQLIMTYQEKDKAKESILYTHPKKPSEPSFHGAGLSSYQAQTQTVADSGSHFTQEVEESLECPRCFKEFKLADMEKYQTHISKCQDE